MKAIVYRNAKGPVLVALLRGDDIPERAALPGALRDIQTMNLVAKGSGVSWEDWGKTLAARPDWGDWSLEDVPDGMTGPREALGYVRQRDVIRNSGGIPASS